MLSAYSDWPVNWLVLNWQWKMKKKKRKFNETKFTFSSFFLLSFCFRFNDGSQLKIPAVITYKRNGNFMLNAKAINVHENDDEDENNMSHWFFFLCGWVVAVVVIVPFEMSFFSFWGRFPFRFVIIVRSIVCLFIAFANWNNKYIINLRDASNGRWWNFLFVLKFEGVIRRKSMQQFFFFFCSGCFSFIYGWWIVKVAARTTTERKAQDDVR